MCPAPGGQLPAAVVLWRASVSAPANPALPPPAERRLLRAMGRWTLIALVINSIIGSGVFRLPAEVSGLLGAMSPWGWLVAALGMGLIMACFAEVASRFSGAGGPYLYARETFGPFVGVQMFWVAWLVRLTSGAANANLFVIYLGEFLPATRQPGTRALVLSVLIAVLVAVNYRGVKSGARFNNVLTVSKLVPLLFFVAAGGLYLLVRGGEAPAAPAAAPEAQAWLQAVLLMVFAYGGFEAALMPMGEARSPRQDAPIALFAALAVCAVLYTLVQAVVSGALAEPALSERPLADAARVFLGGTGALFITVGALISSGGLLAASTLTSPRLTFAMGERGDFPRAFAAVHPRFRTPHVSIVIYGLLVWGFAVFWDFVGNVTLSVISRLITYGLVCLALLVLRRRDPAGADFRLPWGSAVALAGMAFTILVLTQMRRAELVVMAGVFLIAAVNWLVMRNRSRE
jgi:APA family basic amino acid/polyamine antiporter